RHTRFSRDWSSDVCSSDLNKDPSIQSLVLKDVTHQILEGNQSIIGLMLESNIHFGNQNIPKDLSELKYGVSVTDACIDWAETERSEERRVGKGGSAQRTAV